MFAAVHAADARALTACEALRGRTLPEELEVCFREIVASVEIEKAELRRLRSLSTFDAQTAAEAIASDVEWKTGLIEELSFDLSPDWKDALVACWAEKPWLRDLPS